MGEPATATAQPFKYDDLCLFIGGERIAAGDRDTSPVINPATGQVIGRIPHATVQDLDQALDVAESSFAIWSKMPAYSRAKILKRTAELIRERARHIERLMTTEEGKALHEAEYEIAAAADYFEWFAEQGKRAYGRVVPARRPEVQQLVKRQPIGPVAAFTPWNFPGITPSRKLAAALAAGCSVIIKAAEECPATALAIVRALDDAGLPKGVVQMVFGVPSEISSHLIASPIIRKVTFTGSVPVGRLLASQAAQGVKPITLELGGHGPAWYSTTPTSMKRPRSARPIDSAVRGRSASPPRAFWSNDRATSASRRSLSPRPKR
jgi:succinate-semialdehyde dehydrogenase / glutarate-semialdehyde dehydrogenase